MIFNMIGPPAAGKSFICSNYFLEHPLSFYTSIDEWRHWWGNEEQAWWSFEKCIKANSPILIESSGLSWRLPSILKRAARPIYTIALLASKEVLYQRLQERQHKRQLPYKLRMDEKQSIDWVLQNIGSCEYPIDWIIRTDEVSKEELYTMVSERIEEIRLKIAKEKVNVIQ